MLSSQTFHLGVYGTSKRGPKLFFFFFLKILYISRNQVKNVLTDLPIAFWLVHSLLYWVQKHLIQPSKELFEHLGMWQLRHKKELQILFPPKKHTFKSKKECFLRQTITSTGTLKGPIKGRVKLRFLFFLLRSSSLVLSGVYEYLRVVADDTKAEASCSHRRWQIWKKKWKKQKEQEGRNRFEMALPILTERRPVSLKQMGKVTTVTV